MTARTPPRTIVKTRGAIEREKLMQIANVDEDGGDVHSLKVRSEILDPNIMKNELSKITEQLPHKSGSLKIELGDFKPVLSKKGSNRSSVSARRKQLELEAAEAKAKIEKDLIDKRLEAEIAALENESSHGSRYSKKDSLPETSKRVEEWLEKSQQESQKLHAGSPPPAPHAAIPPPAPHASNAPRDDVQHLARAMENLAVATYSTNTQLLSRLAAPKDLPVFFGEPLEWLQFKKAYVESTKLCNYSNCENVARLSKCLRGEAREAVSSLLISDATPSVIIEALELRFGRPELIIYKIASQLKKLPPLPQTYHTDIVIFAVKVKNYVAAAQSINQTDYLRSPELLNTVISKCPSALINKWVDYVYENRNNNKAKLQIFAEFLHREATRVAAAGISHIPSQSDHRIYKKTDERKIQVHSVLNNGSDTSVKCKLCRTIAHPLTCCNKFKRALRKDRWRIVKIHNLCHKCMLPGHCKETCTAAPCDVDECGLAHHRLLHWPAKKIVSSAAGDTTQNNINNITNLPSSSETDYNRNTQNSTSGTVTNTTIVTPGTSVLLKIVRVNIHGPKGVIKTHALLDDGATVSLIAADLADCVDLKGLPETLRIRGAWNSDIVCRSEIVNFKLTNNNNQVYEMRARKISELDLPVQNLSRVNVDMYEHLRNLKDYLCCNSDVKPKLLIGQDNFHLLRTLKTIYRGKNEPCATLSPLGWSVSGIVPARGRALTTEPELALITTLCPAAAAPAPDCAACTPLSAANPADTSAARRETHTCTGAPTYSMQQCNSHAHTCDQDSKQLHEFVRRSFAFDAIGVTLKPRVNKDELRAIEMIDKSAQLIDGRWEVCLPWKNDTKMPNSYSNAYKRYLGVERKMSANENYASRYLERINHLFENDYARKLTDDEVSMPQNHEWYLPHFGVDNPNKSKLRLVFDAAATTAGQSLNDYLLQGPDLLQSLLGIMLRFREKPVAFIGDIKDMFLRIKIRKEDQHALRFLWREDKNCDVEKFAMTSLIFGANCSPFIAQHIKNKNALRFKEEMPEAVEAILKSHYVDDYIESVNDEQTAEKMIRNVTEIHRQGGFQIRNWICNKPQVLKCAPKESVSEKAITMKTGYNDLPERTLGLLWFPTSDTFGFDLSLKRIPSEITTLQRKPTKRELLRILMSIFDIFGFLAPFTVKAKIVLQNTWKKEIKWDDVIPETENVIFRDWITALKKLQYLRIPRCLFPSSTTESEWDDANPATRAHYNPMSQKETTIQLHVFCDAAPTAFTAVAYWRRETKTNDSMCVSASFIACKCRASNINKYTSIPKLELQSAVIACRLADTIARESRIIPDKRFFWTDSLIVLHQIKNDTRNYKVFVANRLGEIDDLSQSNEWHYVPSKMNIADKATKLNTYELTDDCEWLRGPDFLYTPYQNWPKYEAEKEKTFSDEILQVNTIHKIENLDLPVPDATKFSSWLRLWRCTANVLLFIAKCRSHGTAELDTGMMQRAETEIIRYAQMQLFAREIYLLRNKKPIEPDSRLRTLTPFLDECGLLRVGGRIEAALDVNPELKRPVILDGRHPIAKLIVKHYHEKAAHSSNEMIVNEIRQKYWLLHLRPTVRTVASRCLICRIKKAKPSIPRMGDLPEGRLAHHQRPFTHCGVDLFGPMEATVGRRHEKRYGVLFTCLTIRAIHIEVVPSLSADSFIMALRRMAARRGWPYRMYSDNGTNLRGSEAELQKSFREINKSDIHDDLINKGLEWHFISPASPHMAGAWERLIRSVKTALRAILKERAPRDEVLNTLLSEVENMVNSRPLTHVSVDPDDPESLTPNHFLIGSSSNLPVPGEFTDCDMYRKKLWRKAQRLTDMFWRRWVREVLPTLLPRRKWHQEGNNLKKGDVVVIVDPSSPRNTWPKGLIVDVHPGADGRVRVVDIKTKSGILTRPATRLAVLPKADDDCP